MNDLNANVTTKDALAGSRPKATRPASPFTSARMRSPPTPSPPQRWAATVGGNFGLEMLPFRENGGRGYRCLVWCPACDAAFEM